jgi:16S rRNA (adenine1518-N6/adenine1519-N6)-dimethyltransferase
MHSDIPQFCRSHGLRLNKDLGQHFLIDEEALNTIVETADIKEDEHVLEIGAGIGVLTKELVKKTTNVTTIELDEKLIPLLKEYVSDDHTSPDGLRGASELTIIQGNALEIPFPKDRYKIVANIPYHITSPLLRHIFIEGYAMPYSITLLIQQEVADRICDDVSAGRLTILVGLFGKPRIVRNVPPESFLPPPKVESAILHIDCYKHPRADMRTIDEIFSLTKLAFGQKRKMIRNTIGSLENGMEMLEKVGIDPERRPQTLSVEEWIRLALIPSGT